MELPSPEDIVKKTLTNQSILLVIFAYLLTFDLTSYLPFLRGIYIYFPLIVCLIAIGLNLFLIFFSKVVKEISDFAYRSVPIILEGGWVTLLIFFSFQAFGAV